MSVLVTGGAGFIGSNFVLDWLAQSDEAVINLDNLTYAGKWWHFCVDGGCRCHRLAEFAGKTVRVASAHIETDEDKHVTLSYLSIST